MNRIVAMVFAGLLVVYGVVFFGHEFPKTSGEFEVAQATVGCANPNAVSPAPLINASEQLGMCILQASVADLVDAIAAPATLIPAIIGSCIQYGEATAAQVVQLIEEYFASAPAVDGGLALSSTQAARLKKVHDAAKTLVAAAK
jgi:hypothetical protein